MKDKNISKMLSSVTMVFLSTFFLVFSTFSWFTTNRNIHSNGVSMTIRSQQIESYSAFAYRYDGYYYDMKQNQTYDEEGNKINAVFDMDDYDCLINENNSRNNLIIQINIALNTEYSPNSVKLKAELTTKAGKYESHNDIYNLSDIIQITSGTNLILNTDQKSSTQIYNEATDALAIQDGEKGSTFISYDKIGDTIEFSEKVSTITFEEEIGQQATQNVTLYFNFAYNVYLASELLAKSLGNSNIEFTDLGGITLSLANDIHISFGLEDKQ